MTRLWRGGRSRPRSGRIRAAGLLLALAATACFTSSDRNATPPTGVIGIAPGGGTGSSSGSFDGTYRLQTVRGLAVPALIFYDSTQGVDDTVFAASFDSSFISLNSDNSAREIDFLTFRDIRIDGDSDVDRTVSFGDTTGGTWSVSGQTVVLARTDTVGGAHQVITDFAASGTTLTGLITYSLFNTAGTLVVTDTSTVVYDLVGPPLSRRVRAAASVAGPAPAPLRAALPIRIRAPLRGVLRGR